MKLAQHGLLAAWITALVATTTSLTLSEILHYLPCNLCWYQRTLMFPLVLLLGIGYLKRDRNVTSYALPLSVLGVVIAAYHTLLQWGVIPDITPCVATVPCGVSQLTLLGFITIPLMSLAAFGAITGCLLAYRRTAA